MNEIALAVQNVAVAYGEKPVVTDVNMEFPAHQITALIGASGSGKSTLLRSLNRMNDEIATVTGQINSTASTSTGSKPTFTGFANKSGWSFSNRPPFRCQFMKM